MIPSINAGSSKEAVIARLLKFPRDLGNVSKKLRTDIDVIRVAIIKDGLMLRYASKELRNNIELAKIAVSSNGLAIQHCSQASFNKEVQILAINQNVKAIKYINLDQELMRIALELDAESVMQYYWIGPLIHEQYSNLFTKELCMIAVTQNGKCLSFIPNNLKEDRELVMQAVSQDGLSIAYAAINFKSDREICKIAIQQNGEAYRLISNNLRQDKELLMLAIPTYGTAYYYHRENSIFTSDIQVILEVLKYHPDMYKSTAFNIEANIKRAKIPDKTLLQATVESGNQYTIRNMAGEVVSAFEMNDNDKDYTKMKEIIAEHSGLAIGAIVLDIEPKIAIVCKGKYRGKFGEIIKTTNHMCTIKIAGDDEKIKIYQDSILEY
tara:strand:+ start:198 stop:1340 length:1143 start_codon:yes stop_codon:yes gene_type:complete